MTASPCRQNLALQLGLRRGDRCVSIAPGAPAAHKLLSFVNLFGPSQSGQ